MHLCCQDTLWRRWRWRPVSTTSTTTTITKRQQQQQDELIDRYGDPAWPGLAWLWLWANAHCWHVPCLCSRAGSPSSSSTPLAAAKNICSCCNRSKCLACLASPVLSCGNQTISKWYVQPLLEFYVAFCCCCCCCSRCCCCCGILSTTFVHL